MGRDEGRIAGEPGQTENRLCLRIRPMSLADLPTVLEIEKECFPAPWSERIFRDVLDLDYYHFLTAILDGEVAGYCGYIRSFETADIANIAVRGSLRRSGIGEKLLRKLMDDGYRAGVERFSLEVRASNAPAIALYEKLGYRQEGLRRGYYENPREDALILWTPEKSDT